MKYLLNKKNKKGNLFNYSFLMKQVWLKLEIVGSFLHRLFCKQTLPNFYRVSDGFFRGGQPKEKGFDELRQMGVKTIVNMRAIDSDRKFIKQRFHYEHIGFHPSKPPKDEVLSFLRIVSNKSLHPIFLHCYFGVDRTGMLCAIYRIIIEGKSKEEAIEEMKKFGFHFWHRGLLKFVQELDIDSIKQSLGIHS
jgi:protein tyrosine/serine phosphatase